MLSRSLKHTADGVLVIDKKLAAFLQSFSQESDRGIAIIVGTVVEERLGRLLREILVQQKESDIFVSRNLAGLEARARAAYCIGIISRREYDIIEFIRRVRNDFAHQFITDKFDGTLDGKKAAIFDAMAKFLPGYDRDNMSVRSAFQSLAIDIITTIWEREHEFDKSEYLLERE